MSELSTRIAGLSPGRRELLLRTLGQAADTGAHEPIAIIGMSCRFPAPAADADTPEAFWRLLASAGDAITTVPRDRFDADAFHHPDHRVPGTMNSRSGAFLQAVDRFDAGFFGIAPREAQSMDPQHRLLLEVAIHALEDAGRPASTLAGSNTAVLAAVYQRDYLRAALADPVAIDAYTTSGIHHGIAANRLSYLLDLRGPSMVVDTACSSSLVAVHLACQSLRRRECELAVVGAANLILAPEETISLARWGMLAGDGRCKSFDARADGFVRGEGVGVIVLARLSDALAADSRVRAVIAGSAINQDGRSSGLTAPSVAAQRVVITAALADARIAPARVGYVETHGTGTALGDPIEIDALSTVLGAGDEPCLLGAVKTNIGHLEAASGMAALIKAVLALEHDAIPANLHFRRLNPVIDLAGTRFVVPTTMVPWARTGQPRVAGISSFGMGGTNAHIVLTDAPDPVAAAALPAARDAAGDAAIAAITAEPAATGPRAHLLPLSATSPAALSVLAERWLALVRDGSSRPDIDQACATAALCRSHYRHRLAVAAHGHEQLGERLSAFLAKEARPGLHAGRAADTPWHGVVFVFPGQGGQWPGMARRLVALEPVFRDAIACCIAAARALPRTHGADAEHAAELAAWLEAALAPAAAGAAPELARIDLVQPLLFSIQVSLAALWRSWGIEPDAVIGHSMGEAAAAHVAGALDLGDAMAVIALRSRLMAALRGTGAMAAVQLAFADASRAAAARAKHPDQAPIAVAADNSPVSSVIAGQPAAVDELIVELTGRGVLCRRLAVDVASHSPALDPLATDLMAALAAVRPHPPRLRFYSTVHGHDFTGLLDPAYWVANARQPVRFWPAAQALVAAGHRIFVELSPHPTLLPALEEGLHQLGLGAQAALVPSLRANDDDHATMLGALGALHVAGVKVSWPALHPRGAPRVAVPHYPFQRERFWLPAPRARAAAAGTHPLLGAPVPVSPRFGGHLWTSELTADSAPFLRDHHVQDTVVMPGTAVMEMAIAAATQRFGRDRSQGRAHGREGEDSVNSSHGTSHTDNDHMDTNNHMIGAIDAVIEHIDYEHMIMLDHEPRTLQLSLISRGPDRAELELHGRAAGSAHWILHARGVVARAALADQPRRAPDRSIDIRALRARLAPGMSGAELYRQAHERGNGWGAAFQAVSRVACGPDELLVELACPPAIAARLGRYHIHPALLDACGQALFLLAEPTQQGSFMLASVGRVRVHGPLQPDLVSHIVRSPGQEPGCVSGDIQIAAADSDGRVLVEIQGLRIRFLEGTGAARGRPADWLYRVAWQPMPLAAPTRLQALAQPARPDPATIAPDRGLLLIADHGGMAAAVAEHRPAGTPIVLVEGHQPGEPDAPEQLGEPIARAMTATFAADPARSWDIVHLAALDLDTPDWDTHDMDAESISRAAEIACMSAISAMRTLMRASGPGTSHRLWLVTRGAQPAGEPPRPHDEAAGQPTPFSLSPAQTALWGLGRSLEAEAPRHLGALVDLDPRAATSDAARDLLAELAAGYPRTELHISYRNGERHVARLRRLEPARRGSTEAIFLAPDSTYLVTGGLGDLGLAVARWLIERGARHLVLMSRRPLPPRTAWQSFAASTADDPDTIATAARIRAVRALEAMGAGVRPCAIDIADPAQLGAFLAAHAAEKRPPIRGIVHAAGTQHPVPLDGGEHPPHAMHAAMDADFRAKVAGSWLLAQALPEVDFLICFSSAATLFGSPFLAPYAAANAFMDGLAHALSARGRRAVAIDWSFWAGSAMARRYDHAHGRSSRPRGMDELAPAQALAAMELALAAAVPQAAVVPIDWSAWRRHYPATAETAFFADLGARQLGGSAALAGMAHGAVAIPGDDTDTAGITSAAELTRAIIDRAPEAARPALLASYLARALARVLKTSPARVPMDEPLTRLGLDSLMAVELRNRIEIDLEISVPIVRILGCAGAEALAAELGARVEHTAGWDDVII